MGVVIKAIRASAEGERCTFCGRRDDTVVFCHGPRMGMAGMGQKMHDWWGAYGCGECHLGLDQHILSWENELTLWMTGIPKTIERLIAKGIIQLPETPVARVEVPKIVPRPERFRR